MPDAWFRERFVPPPAEGERLEHDEGLPCGESKATWARRVYAAMDQVATDPSSTKVVVTHGGSITFVVTHLQRDDYFHNHAVVSLGATEHLRGR